MLHNSFCWFKVAVEFSKLTYIDQDPVGLSAIWKKENTQVI